MRIYRVLEIALGIVIGSVLILIVYWIIKHFNEIKQNVDSTPLTSLVGIVLVLITIILGIGSYLINREIKKIEKIEDYKRDLQFVVSTMVETNILRLPPLHYTQHIPRESFRIFKEITHLFEENTEESYLVIKSVKVRLFLATAIYYYCKRNEKKAIKYFEKAKDEATTDMERLIALWRLGIAYRQAEKFKESKDIFDEMLRLAKSGSEFWSLGLKGKALTLYSEFKRSKKYNTLIWGTCEISDTEEGLLRQASRYFEELWQKEFRDPQFTSFYWALIKTELSEGLIFDGINLLDFTIEESTANGKLYPYQDDYAILADFYFSIAICYHYKDNGQVLERNRYAKLTKHYAQIVQNEYTDYDLIYSERRLVEIPAADFLKEIPEGWLV